MPLNQELLERAREAGAELAEHERRVLLARGEYHAAIRKLHLAGGSLRDIADALSFSHQRVQQIVTASGGSWWRRVWRTRNARRDAVCTWCDRPANEVSKLVAGPNVYICDACLELAGAALHDAWGTSETLRRAPEGAKERCSFCNKRSGRDRSLVIGPAAHICSECMRICRDFMDDRVA
jgi:ClpX C4-type zinc finger